MIWLGAAVWAWPTVSHAEASFANAAGKASASLSFRIIIPAVMRIVENSHPNQLQPSADGSALTGEQRLVVMSNMKHGFCIVLRQSDPQLGTWQLQTSTQEAGTRLTPTADGYRLCTSRPGRYTLLLQHAFSGTRLASNDSAPFSWPVQTDLLTL